jgi:GxxExxY protein
MHINELSESIIGECIKIHRALGPGLLENVYKQCLSNALDRAGLRTEKEVPISLTYDGISIPMAFRADLIVEDAIIVEVKSVESIAPVHKAQTLTYLKLSGLRLGLLINFGQPTLKDGIRRFINTPDGKVL